MATKVAFDNEKYIAEQTSEILERVNKFSDKLYLEFGGKLLFDYHDYRRGINSGYAKFETFPIWNLLIKPPVNIAYEAATVDIKDFNLIDPFHLEAYNEKAVNYNRDVEVFPILKRILKRISGDESFY